MADYNTANDLRLFSAGGHLMSIHIFHNLRVAFGGFLILLQMDYTDIYKCLLCESQPEVLICDGIMIGTKKEIISQYEKPPVPEQVINGSTINQSMFGLSPQARSLLAKYTRYLNCNIKMGEAGPNMCFVHIFVKIVGPILQAIFPLRNCIIPIWGLRIIFIISPFS